MGRNRSYSRSSSRSSTGSLSSTSSGRAAKARHWNGEGGYRLHLSDLAIGVSRRSIEKLFRPYGPLNEVWVASNPPCFAFINFRHRADGEKALKELDGKVVDGSRIGLSWARPRNRGGRAIHALIRHSRSPSFRRGFRKRRYSRSRSRSSSYRRRNSRSRSSSPRDKRREKNLKTNQRRHCSRSKSNSNASDFRKKISRSPNDERQQATTSNGDDRRSA